jgi:MFS transporter, DHA1 family, tetracycline resistance protein
MLVAMLVVPMALQISPLRPTPLVHTQLHPVTLTATADRLPSVVLLHSRLRPTTLTATADRPPSVVPPTALFMAVAGLQSACFGCIGTALPPALRAAGMEPASVALLLGRLGSASAFFEVLCSGAFGRLADAIGRKPVMLAAPAITVAARSLVVVWPTLPMLIGARLVTTLAVPIYWLAYSACLADCYGKNATQLAVVGSRVQAAMGLGYALSSLLGGPLAQRDIRLAYAASCSLGCCVLACIGIGLRETLPEGRRVPFAWGGGSPLGFQNLFRRSSLSAKLNLVVVCQSLTNGMGDLWQVLARELRGWGAAQCGRFAATAGLASMLGTLLTGPSIRRLGPRGHTVASTSSSAVASLVLGHATSNAVAFVGVAPMALGAGKGQATSARIINLGEEMRVPQGQLAAERNTLNAIIKVLAPSFYAWLFTIGVRRGVLGLPFYATAALMVASAAIAASIPKSDWKQAKPVPPDDE